MQVQEKGEFSLFTKGGIKKSSWNGCMFQAHPAGHDGREGCSHFKNYHPQTKLLETLDFTHQNTVLIQQQFREAQHEMDVT